MTRILLTRILRSSWLGYSDRPGSDTPIVLARILRSSWLGYSDRALTRILRSGADKGRPGAAGVGALRPPGHRPGRRTPGRRRGRPHRRPVRPGRPGPGRFQRWRGMRRRAMAGGGLAVCTGARLAASTTSGSLVAREISGSRPSSSFRRRLAASSPDGAVAGALQPAPSLMGMADGGRHGHAPT